MHLLWVLSLEGLAGVEPAWVSFAHESTLVRLWPGRLGRTRTGALGIVGCLSVGGSASVPFGFSLLGALRGLPTLILCLSYLFADPGVSWIVAFPAGLFFGKGFVPPRNGGARG